ncbi:MAG: TetR/AcrR family transcriptional regulator [Bacillaceae bacterium]
MGRKQAFTKLQLLETTEKLLLQYGYEGFHLKLLSTHVGGARSTIYLYYKSKEEIVAACMKRVMERMLAETSAIDETNTMEALKKLLYIYLREADLHFLLMNVQKVDMDDSEATKRDIEYIKAGHELLKGQLGRLGQAAKEEGHLRDDIPIVVTMSVFFTLINTRNPASISLEQWTDLLFTIWLEGAGMK